MPATIPTKVETVSTPQTPAELLLQAVRPGRYDLPRRMVMAPLTRSRAGQPGKVPTKLNACYYAQRAWAALIISEATQVSLQRQGYAWPALVCRRTRVRGGVGERILSPQGESSCLN